MTAVDEIIREAMSRGEFNNLPGAGKPVNLDAYFSTPEEVRMVYSILRNAGILPREIELLREIAKLMDELKAASDSEEKNKILDKINKKQLEYSLRMENIKHQKA
jgi:hypothetical protein